jgi:hypothetical protein
MKIFTISEFAEKIRTKYPKVYNDLSDKDLVDLWVKKYPKDKEFINFSLDKEKKNKGFFSYLVYLLIFWGLLSIVNLKITEIQFVNSVNKDLFGNNSGFVNVSNSNSNQDPQPEIVDFDQNNLDNSTQYDFPITQDAKDFVNDSPIIKLLKLDENTTNTLLAILSDTNPDPEIRQGEFCDNTISRCLYCNNLVPGKLYTYQEYFRRKISAYNTKCIMAKMLIGDPQSGEQRNRETEDSTGTLYEQLNSVDWKGALSDGIYENLIEIKPLLVESCLKYTNGYKYICVENYITEGSMKFCSEKCKTEYGYSH